MKSKQQDLYGEDLAFIHHVGFADFATRAAPGVLAFLRRVGLDQGLVVDLGCGNGLLARALLRQGYEVLGVDGSRAMIELARKNAPQARFELASLYTVALPPCIAVTAIGEGLTYWGEEDPRERLPRFLAGVYRALAPGGLLIFDAVLRSEKQPMRYSSSQQGPNWRVEVEVDEDPEAFLLERRIETVRRLAGRERRSEEVHRVRTFTRPEIEGALRAAGFTVRVHRRYGAMALPSQRLAFRARKPA